MPARKFNWIPTLAVGGVAAGLYFSNQEHAPITGRNQLIFSLHQPKRLLSQQPAVMPKAHVLIPELSQGWKGSGRQLLLRSHQRIAAAIESDTAFQHHIAQHPRLPLMMTEAFRLLRMLQHQASGLHLWMSKYCTSMQWLQSRTAWLRISMPAMCRNTLGVNRVGQACWIALLAYNRQHRIIARMASPQWQNAGAACTCVRTSQLHPLHAFTVLGHQEMQS